MSFIVRWPSRFIVGLKVKDMDLDRFFIPVFGFILPTAGNDRLLMIKEAKNIEEKLLRFSKRIFLNRVHNYCQQDPSLRNLE